MGSIWRLSRPFTGARDTEEGWRSRAACRDADPEAFFPIGEFGQAAQRQIEDAKSVCQSCPVVVECLEFAVAAGEQDGVWGGKTPNERRQYKLLSQCA